MSEKFSISKRNLIKGVGAGSLMSVLPTWRRAEAATATYDLIVVGIGNAGIPGAIFAAERGAKVLAIDAAPVIGGTLDRSGGQMSASRTVFQKAKGIEDSPDDHYADHMRINGNTSDPMVTRMFVDNAGDSLNWLAANGFKVADDMPVKGNGHEYFTIARYQWGKDMGKSILATMKPLYEKQEQAGKITTLLNTSVVDLIQDNSGAIVGVTAEDESGKLTDYMAKNVMLSAGGSASNPRMFRDQHNSELKALIAYPFSQGMGFTLGQRAGGYLRAGDKYLGGSFGSLLADDNFPSTVLTSFEHHPDKREPWEIYVNAHGHRFMKEDHPSIDYRERSLLHQPGERFWVVADQEMIDKAPLWFPRWSKEKFMEGFGTHPWFTKADTIRALATKAGIDSANLDATVKAFNSAINEGVADPWGRAHRPMQIKKGPFYAVRLTATQLKSFCGLAIDGKLRVIRRDGSPIPNLFAAGEVIGGGVTGGAAYTNGSNVTPALTFGRMIGQRMIKFNA